MRKNSPSRDVGIEGGGGGHFRGGGGKHCPLLLSIHIWSHHRQQPITTQSAPYCANCILQSCTYRIAEKFCGLQLS